MSKLTIAKLFAAPEVWDRRRLQLLLVVAAVVTALMVTGAVWSVWSLLHSDASTDPPTFVSPRVGLSVRNKIADAPLPTANLQAAQQGPLSTRTAPTLMIPPPESLGLAQVQTGFPHTVPGALAQLVAIDQRAIQSASVVTAQAVIANWALPGGPTVRTWSGVEAVTILLSSSGLPGDGSPDLRIGLHPAMGLVKGSVGADYVVPCVDFVVEVTAGAGPPTRVAAADCQRMVWSAGRWMIGPGREPAPAPSVWPGTAVSYRFGYRWLKVSP